MEGQAAVSGELTRIADLECSLTTPAGCRPSKPDRSEDDGEGWSWWTVVVVTHEPSWAFVRRVSASDVIEAPLFAGRKLDLR